MLNNLKTCPKSPFELRNGPSNYRVSNIYFTLTNRVTVTGHPYAIHSRINNYYALKWVSLFINPLTVIDMIKWALSRSSRAGSTITGITCCFFGQK